MVGASPPGRDHRDIAALSHHVFAKVSANPDIESVCRTVRDAGDRIRAYAPNSDLRIRVEQRIENLRHAFDLYCEKSNPPRRNVVLGLRRLKRKLASLYRRYVGARFARGLKP